MKLTTVRLLSCILFIGATFFSFSQTEPLSLAKAGNFVEKTDLDKGIPSLTVSPPDVELLKSEDIVRDENGELFRIAQAVSSNTDINSIGQWTTLSDGSRILRMKVKSSDAEALAISFSNFHLPTGATFRAYNKDQWHFSKIYSSEDNREDNGFMLPMVFGEEIILEFLEPANSTQAVEATIDEVFYVYRESGNPMIQKDFGDSDPCQVNVNCTPEGSNWLDENRGVARIFVVVGASGGWCTGSLVNNTAQDCKPYFLTALHCGDGASAANFNNWVFYFRYEGPGCANPGTQGSLANNTISGCVEISGSNDGGGNTGSDFLLVQLGSLANEATTIANLKSPGINARWNGWDANNTTSNQGVSIHHPAGDIKKISTYSSNLVSTTWGGTPGTHWRVVWAATANGHGVTEGGSSGSPIFRYNGGGAAEDSKIIGTLTGGSSFCATPTQPDLYGKMSYHWQSNGGNNNEQLRPFLDPGNTGLLVMNGSDDPCSTPAVPVADFVANQTSVLEGTVVQFTDLTGGVPTSWDWTITPGTNGVEWEFTNGTTDTDQNPEVLFTTPGLYTVSLTATNGFGNDTETKIDYIEVIEIVCSEPISTAYTMSFETGEDLSQWIVINANGATTWGLYDFDTDAYDGVNTAAYFYDVATPADDWLFTNCFDLVAGADYTISYWWRTGNGYNEDAEFFIGNDQTIAAMSTSLAQHVNVSNETWTQQVVNFTVPTTGVYYFAWHCTSAADEWFFAIDAINLTGSIAALTITSAPANTTIECDESTDPSNTGELTAATGCVGGATISYVDVVVAGTCDNEYTIERTWTVTDGCGGNETHVQMITVEDNTAPVVVCGVATDVLNTSGGTATIPNYVAGATISDNCTANIDLVTTQTPAAGTVVTSGPYVVTIESVDECGNLGSCTINVTVNNNEVITITNTPGNVTIECDESTDPSNTGEYTATTSCATGGLVIDYVDVITAGSCDNEYTIERTWTATDNCGNSEVHVQIITVQDNTAPVVACGMATDEITTATGDAAVPNYVPGATYSDNCTVTGDLIVVQSPLAGTILSSGSHTISIIVTDECGNSNSCSITLTIINDAGITITNAPGNISIECDESTDPANTGQLTGVTSCPGGVIVDYSDVSDGNTCPETITRTWTIEDGCGNNDTHIQTIVINDLTAPTGNAPADVSVQCASDVPAPNVGAVTSVADNCTVTPVVAHVSDVSDGNACPETITRTYSITDDCNNETLVVQLIVINDDVAPTGIAPTNVSVQCVGDVPAPNVGSVTGVTDNCTASPVVAHVSDVSDGNTCPETITRTYSITDDCNNETLVTQQIVVNDDVDPVITCSATSDTLFVTDGTNCPDYTSTVTATDNCTAVVNVSQSPAVGSTLTVGSNTVTITATDDCGNTSSCEVDVVLEDNVNIDSQELNTLAVYPNPAHSTLNIDFGKTMENASLKLYDSNGKLVLALNETNKSAVQMDISSLAKGIYQLMITSNTEVITHKISKM